MPAKKGQRHAGSFKPGNRGGPGRSKVSKNHRTLIYETLVKGHDEQLIKVLVAEAGVARNMIAMRILLDRIWPTRPYKEAPIAFPLPSLDSPAAMMAAAVKVADAMTGGELSPVDGERLLNMINAVRSIHEGVELAKQVEQMRAELDAMKTA